MLVIAYTFETQAGADAACERLVKRFGMGPRDALVAPVADGDSVVGVRARDENVQAVKAILVEHGGEHASELPEEWTLAD